MRPLRRHPFFDHPGPLPFAHRGGGLEAEENTMAAFLHATSLGFRYIETDVQASRDGVAVLLHDETLGRMTGAGGRVIDRSWADLARLRTRGGEPLLRLDAALEAFPRTRFNLDAKTEAAVPAMAGTLRRCAALDRVCIGSFDARRTRRLRALLDDRVPCSPGAGGVLQLWLAGWGLPAGRCAFDAAQIPLRWRGIPLATTRLVAAAHARGIQVHVWTVDSEPEIERLLDLGVDGIMSDRPSLLRRVLERRGVWFDGKP